jgi:hypothetical protein
MLTVGVLLVIVAVLSVVRVEHLIASDFWIAFRGSDWQSGLKHLSEAGKSNVPRMWRAYRENGGGKLPFLFFGIKSYRLLHWSDAAKRHGWKWRSRGLRMVRLAWRFYTFVLLASVLVVALSAAPVRLSTMSRVALLIVAFAMAGGMLAIAAEVVLAALVFGSWAVLYHRWPRPAVRTPRLHEFNLGVGCVLLTQVALFALVFCAETRFHAYPDVPGAGWIAVRDAITASYSGFISNAVATGLGPLAFFINLVTAISYVSYFVFVLQATGRLWGQ